MIVISAPSGAGKTTLCDRLRAERRDLVYSISCTTRPPRGAEADGTDYFFLGEAEFAARLARGEFLEHAAVHGHRYGTPRARVEEALAGGRSVLMDIDVQGAAQVREHVRGLADGSLIKAAFVDIFIAPPSMDELRARLERRGEDAPEVIGRRLRNASAELARAGEFRHRIVNDDLDRAYAELKALIGREERGHV